MNLKRILFSASCMMALCASATSIQEVGGWLETGWVTFSLDSDASSYNVYCKATSGSYELLDSPLVRNYGTYGRADALGLAEGTYQFKVVPVDLDGNELTSAAAESSTFTVNAKDRTGFAFSNDYVPGAYKSDGTLKSNAVVVYITDNNKDAVTLDVVTSSKGTTTEEVGLKNILDGFKKGTDSRPLCIRLIGQITTPDNNDKGDIVVDMNSKETCPGITIEGVGNDATCDGWGIRLKNAISVEVANLGFINCASDEGDNLGLQQNNSYVWVHNCDMFYGEAGSDSDQKKGDGALDCKKSNYVTFSYNHFWDNGKCCLLGLSGESDSMYITYHHNWFDHSDSRHPRVRYYSAHVYNNYYDGNAKYGVGATCGCSVFVENNYFRNTNKPMMISMQGTDIASGDGTFSSEDGGMIKAYGNVFAEQSSNFKLVYYADDNTEFDAYEASSASETVPSSVVTKKGSTCYNNFDTNSSIMYSYTPDAASDVPSVVTGDYGAGRCQHGDLQYTFTNSSDDSSYDVISDLKNALESYSTSFVGLFVEENYSSNDDSTDDETEDDGNDDDNSGTDDNTGNSGSTGNGSDVTVTDSYECWFTGGTPSSSFYTFSNDNYNTSGKYGSATYNGTTYNDCLKIESSTSISFTIDEQMELTLVFGSTETPDIKIDGVKVSATSGNVITYVLDAGDHTITKAGSHYLFYMSLVATDEEEEEEEEDESFYVPEDGLTEDDNSGETNGIQSLTVKGNDAEGTIYDLSGRVISQPKGVYIQNGNKLVKK